MTWKTQVPTYDQLTLPLLQLASDGNVHHIRDAIDTLADHLQLTDDQRNELLPSGKKTRFEDRVQWAKTYLKKAELLNSAGWGKFRITERGLNVLQSNPTIINRKFLMQFPEFKHFVNASRYSGMELTPTDIMESAYLSLKQDLANDLLDIIQASSPRFFERLVIDLLLAMGYGGTHEGAAQTIGRSGDGGIDGYIQEDNLGLDNIYVQAKRWARDKSVGRPDLQGFVGSLIGVGGKKGVFITTSRFSQNAVDYANTVSEMKIILIDGERLTDLMMQYDVGVSVEKRYTIQMINRDYFDID